jgi:hypothetical protein
MNRTQIRKFLSLPAAQKLMLAEALLELARASILLSLVPWRVASNGLMTVDGGEDVETAALIGDSIRIAARYAPWRPTCLRQALATQRMLRRRGLAGRIEISFPDPKDKTHAHAWILCGPIRLLTGTTTHNY